MQVGSSSPTKGTNPLPLQSIATSCWEEPCANKEQGTNKRTMLFVLFCASSSPWTQMPHLGGALHKEGEAGHKRQAGHEQANNNVQVVLCLLLSLHAQRMVHKCINIPLLSSTSTAIIVFISGNAHFCAKKIVLLLLIVVFGRWRGMF